MLRVIHSLLVRLTRSDTVMRIYGPTLLLLALSLGFAQADDVVFSKKTTPARVRAARAQASQHTKSQARHCVTHEFRKGETFAGVVRPLGVFGAESYAWFQAVEKRLPEGKVTDQKFYFYFEKQPAADETGNLRAIQVAPKPGQVFSWRLGDGKIVFERRNSVSKAVETLAAQPAPQRIVTQSMRTGPEVGLASVQHITHTIRRGETLSGIFRRMAVPAQEAQRWFHAVSLKYSIKRLRPGRRVVFYFTTAVNPNSDGQGERGLRALQIETGPNKLLTWQKEGKQIGYYGRASKIAKPAIASLESPSVNLISKHGRRPTRSINSANAESPESETAALSSLHHVRRRLGKGETFAAMVKPLGVTGIESQTWFLALETHRAGRNLSSARRIDLYFENEPAQARTGNLRAIQLHSRSGKTATWRLVGNHIYLGSKKLIALENNRAQGIRGGARSGGGLRKLPLSEYSLARVKQRNGLWAQTKPRMGQRPTASLKTLARITKKIADGDDLLGILEPYGLSEADQQEWLHSIRRDYAAKKLRPGTTVNVYFVKREHDPAEFGPLKAFEIELPDDEIMTWYDSDHGILFYKSEPPYDVEVKAVAGTITTGSVYDAAARVGLHPAVIQQLMDIFGWDINLETDLTKGDKFRVLYTRQFRPGSEEASQIRVLAAEIVSGGQTYTAIYFENANGKGNYYDPNGRTISRSFLRYPVEFLRISSRFSQQRYNPILRVRKPHRGVDFAAKRRTPVKTIGDGTVIYAAWKGAYGRLIEIDHGNGLKTRYAHLQRIAAGIAPGAHVTKGQIIGQVGCSGRCTGPHLHFELWKNEHYVNPLKTDLPPDDELDPTVFKVFEEAKASFLAKLTTSPGDAEQ